MAINTFGANVSKSMDGIFTTWADVIRNQSVFARRLPAHPNAVYFYKYHVRNTFLLFGTQVMKCIGYQVNIPLHRKPSNSPSTFPADSLPKNMFISMGKRLPWTAHSVLLRRAITSLNSYFFLRLTSFIRFAKSCLKMNHTHTRAMRDWKQIIFECTFLFPSSALQIVDVDSFLYRLLRWGCWKPVFSFQSCFMFSSIFFFLLVVAMNGINLLSIEIVCEQRINTFFHDGIVRGAFSSYGYILVVCCCCCWRCAMDTNEKSLPNKKNILCENDITLKVGVGREQTFSLQIIANNAKYPFCWRFLFLLRCASAIH